MPIHVHMCRYKLSHISAVGLTINTIILEKSNEPALPTPKAEFEAQWKGKFV